MTIKGENLSNFIKNNIKNKSFSDKEYVQYILELSVLDDYIKNGVKVSYEWFGIDYLRKKYLNEYIELTKEINGIDSAQKIDINTIQNSKPLCKWIVFDIEQKREWWMNLEWIE